MLVNDISKALHGDPPDNALDDEDESPEGSEEEMSKDNEPNDMMILVQYQLEVRKESLTQKGAHDVLSSLKKGRVDNGEKEI